MPLGTDASRAGERFGMAAEGFRTPGEPAQP